MFQWFHIFKLFATILRNVQEGNPPFQRFHIQKLIETPVPTVPYIELVFNPSIPTVPYLETGGSSGSLYRNRFATHHSKGSIFRTWWFQQLPIQKLFATPRSNSSIFSNCDSNSSLLRNRLQPYLETFKKATTCSNISILKNCFQPYLEYLGRQPPFQWFPIQKLFATPRSNVSIFLNWWFQQLPIQKQVCNPSFQLFFIQKLFATVCNCLEFICNDIQKRVGRQPPVPTVPYLETVSNPFSNGSIFRNCFQPPVPTVPYLETGGCNGSLFKNRLQPYLETFRMATPWSNGSLFINCLKLPFQQFHIQKLICNCQQPHVPTVPWLETDLQLFATRCSNGSIFRNSFATVCNPMFQQFHGQKLICNCLQPHVPTVPYLETDLQLFAIPCSNGSIFRT